MTELSLFPKYNLNDPPTVSIIIPVFNGALTITRLLESLFVQTYSSDRLEIIVINNGSSDSTADYVRVWGNNNIRLFYLTKRGSYAARNLGIKAAKGEIFAFTDADCVADKDWITSGVYCLTEKKVGLVGGDIQLLAQDVPSLAELYELRTAFNQEKYIKKRGFAATANLFVHRRIFDVSGLFNESFQSGGDVEFCNRAVKNGEKIFFCKNAVICHETRKSILDLLKKQFRVGVGRGIIEPEMLLLNECLRQGAQNYSEQNDNRMTSDLSLSWAIKIKALYFCIMMVFNIAYIFGYFLRLTRGLQGKSYVKSARI